MAGIPKAAAKILDDGVLCYVAVHTAHGPHLTPVVYAMHAGRVWITTSRGSIKARAWKIIPVVAGAVRHDGKAVTFRGVVSTYDALNPWTWPGAVLSGPRLARAAAKFSLKNARFFAGYAVDANRVPLSWSPPGRVFAGISITAGWLIDEDDGRVIEGWGEWPVGLPEAAPEKGGRQKPSARRLHGSVPEPVLTELGDKGHGALALEGSRSQLTVLSAEWRRDGSDGSYGATLPASIIELANATAETNAALTADRASRWRAADMTGVLLQGRAQIHPGADPVRVRLSPSRLVWWRGWTSGTVTSMSGAAS
jgi:hypothetical protein